MNTNTNSNAININTNIDETKMQENITFFLQEPPIEELEDNNVILDQMMQEFEELDQEPFSSYELEIESEYFIKKNIYSGNEELYYDEEYTVKDLMKICQYYDISKNIKASKCKKQDIIATIVYFESIIENYDIVQQRHKMWSHMTDLLADPKMRCYLLWS